MGRRLTGIPRARIATHGDFPRSARLTHEIKCAMARSRNVKTISPEHREALSMIVFKIARILNGDPNHVDHWNDIAGYAQLGARACQPKASRR